MNLAGNAAPVWINESELVQADGWDYSVLAREKTDLFCALDGETVIKSASLYGWKVTGDCVIEAEVSMKRTGNYDGAGLILFGDERHWAKCCMEATDFGKIAVITVMTDGVSDDANGPNITNDSVWLRLVRKGNDCSVHYSFDGKYYEMYRICKVNLPETVTAALVAQAPVGPAGYRHFRNVKVEEKTVADLRKGE